MTRNLETTSRTATTRESSKRKSMVFEEPNWLAIPLQTEKRYELLHFLEENNIQFNMDNEQLDLLMVKKLRIINIEKISV